MAKADQVIRAVAHTAHDSNSLAVNADGIVATTLGGTCTVVFPDNSTCQYTLVIGAPLMGIKIKRVNATGTASTGHVALYVQ